MENDELIVKIKKSLDKIKPDLSDKVILTEAATGNYVITSILAGLSNAKKVFAFTKDSKYGTVDEVIKQTKRLIDVFNLDNIEIITDLNKIDLSNVNVITNTGFLRPITKDILSKTKKVVIPLMYEPWEFRGQDLDLEYCIKNKILVYGTNESDTRLNIMEYIGKTIYKLILENKLDLSYKYLLIGNSKFVMPSIRFLKKKLKNIDYIIDFNNLNEEEIQYKIKSVDVIVFAENERNIKLLGNNGIIKPEWLTNINALIHISGSVDFNFLNKNKIKLIPEKPKEFGYMSFTTDYADVQAVIDLHCGALKVAEGMLKALEKGLSGIKRKNFIEKEYIGLAFDDPRLW